MPVPAAIKVSVDAELAAYCARKFPLHVRDQVWATHGWRGIAVTLYEWRPRFDQPDKAVDIKVAQFRYDDGGRWSLFYADRNGKWHPYHDRPATTRFSDLLAEVDQDPTGIFWG